MSRNTTWHVLLPEYMYTPSVRLHLQPELLTEDIYMVSFQGVEYQKIKTEITMDFRNIFIKITLCYNNKLLECKINSVVFVWQMIRVVWYRRYDADFARSFITNYVIVTSSACTLEAPSIRCVLPWLPTSELMDCGIYTTDAQENPKNVVLVSHSDMWITVRVLVWRVQADSPVSIIMYDVYLCLAHDSEHINSSLGRIGGW